MKLAYVKIAFAALIKNELSESQNSAFRYLFFTKTPLEFGKPKEDEFSTIPNYRHLSAPGSTTGWAYLGWIVTGV